MALLKKDMADAGARMDESYRGSDRLYSILKGVIDAQNLMLVNQDALIAADGGVTTGIVSVPAADRNSVE